MTTIHSTTDHIVKAVLLGYAGRVSAICLLFLGSDANGEPFAVGPSDFLVLAIPYAAIVFSAFLVLVLLARGIALHLIPLGRWQTSVMYAIRLVTAIAIAASAALVFVDYSTQRHTGDRLSLVVVKHYLSFDTVDGEFLDTLLADAWNTFTLAFVLIGSTAAALWVLRPRRDVGTPVATTTPRRQPVSVFTAMTRSRLVRALAAALVVFLSISIPFYTLAVLRPKNFRLRLVAPVEQMLVRDAVFGVGLPRPASEVLSLYTIRHLWSLHGGALWASPLTDPPPRYPLVRRIEPAVCDAQQRVATATPDIVVVVMESLRGRDVGFIRRINDTTSNTPCIDRLASQGVGFDRFVSSAPSSRNAFFAIQCSMWPHLTLIPVTSFTHIDFDCVSDRLLTFANYDPIIGVAYNPSMENLLPWMKKLYTRRVYPRTGGARRDMSDGQLYDAVLAEMRASEARNSSRPIFSYVVTASTHAPFVTHDEDYERHTPHGKTTYDAYLRSLRYADRELGRFVDALQAREREVVVIVLGDHSYPMSGGDEYDPLPGVRGLPCDHRSYTAGVVWTHRASPRVSDIVGNVPRVVSAPVSSVDVLATILDITGDRRPTASFGRSLLSPQLRDRLVVSIAEGGQRMTTATANCYSIPAFNQSWAVLDAQGRFPDRCSPTSHSPPQLGADQALPSIATCAELMMHINVAAEYLSYLMQENRIWSPHLLAATTTPIDCNAPDNRTSMPPMEWAAHPSTGFIIGGPAQQISLAMLLSIALAIANVAAFTLWRLSRRSRAR